jgi:hypothetical protein
VKALALGAVLGLLWLLLGVQFAAPVTAVLPLLVQPVVLAFAAGLIARPYLARRWTA